MKQIFMTLGFGGGAPKAAGCGSTRPVVEVPDWLWNGRIASGDPGGAQGSFGEPLELLDAPGKLWGALVSLWSSWGPLGKLWGVLGSFGQL